MSAYYLLVTNLLLFGLNLGEIQAGKKLSIGEMIAPLISVLVAVVDLVIR